MQCQFYFSNKKHESAEIPLVMIKMIAAFYNKYILLLFKLRDYFKKPFIISNKIRILFIQKESSNKMKPIFLKTRCIHVFPTGETGSTILQLNRINSTLKNPLTLSF